MKKVLILMWIFLSAAKPVSAQRSHIDSLNRELGVSRNDTISLILMGNISSEYAEINPDSSYHYATRMLSLTRKLKLKLDEARALDAMGYALLNMGNYPRSLTTLLQAVSIAENPNSEKNVLPSRFPALDEFSNPGLSPRLQRIERLSRIRQDLAILYGNSGNYKKAFYYYRLAIPLAEEANSLPVQTIIYITMGRAYLALDVQDSALLFLEKAYACAIEAGFRKYIGSILLNTGRVYMAMGDQGKAKEHYQKALRESIEHDYFRGVVASNLVLADIHKQAGRKDSSFFHIQHALKMANYLNLPELLLRSYTALAEFYKNVNSDSTVKYQSLIIQLNNVIFSAKQVQQFQNIDFDEQQRQQEILAARKDYADRQQKYMLLGVLAVFFGLAIFLWRNNLRRQRTNFILEEQKREIETTLTDLKSTQAQLIQSEKMASLGELTAGIAHEIQNPLNFVNNFSEVNSELISDMREALKLGNIEEATSLANTIDENENKIVFHGKRADSIVKGMLQHSRSSSGVKELTEINALADEYLRLAFHGLRAKDKSFNSAMRTAFDESVGKVQVIPQDIGRVILNLITNAFYAVDEKKRQRPNGYEPTVWVSTKRYGAKVEIRVKDNGNGIPQRVLDKIFQPFFTTKPTGKGTGLGLSMSYDIVTKGHGGQLQVNTQEGEFAEFIITLPIT